MPKLNVQQNNANVIKALRNALAIGQIKGPIASDGADNFSSAGSNRNLLDNPFFTVNQRGFTSGNMGVLVYWADRWMNNTDTTNPATLSLNNGIVTITTPSGTGRFGNILQTLADPAAIEGKVVTLSALKSDNTIISGTITRVAGTTQDAYHKDGITLRLSSTNRFAVQADDGASISIKACKLELGTVSTLANDVPPDYGTELLKCQRYFFKFTLGGDVIVRIAGTPTSASAMLPLPVTMRGTTATVATTAAGSIVVNKTLVTVTSLGSTANIMPNGASVTLTIPSGQTARDIGTWFNYSCTLSCDL